MKRKQELELENVKKDINDKSNTLLAIQGVLEIIDNLTKQLKTSYNEVISKHNSDQNDNIAKYEAIASQVDRKIKDDIEYQKETQNSLDAITGDVNTNRDKIKVVDDKTSELSTKLSTTDKSLSQTNKELSTISPELSKLDKRLKEIESIEVRDGKDADPVDINDIVRQSTVEVIKKLKIQDRGQEYSIEQVRKDIEDAIVEKLEGIQSGLTEDEVKELILKYRKGARIVNQAKWGEVSGNIQLQTDLIEYLEGNYQPLEDQRLSTTDNVAFNSVNINAETTLGTITENTEERTLSVNLDNGVSGEMFLEEHENAYNKTGSDTIDGKVCFYDDSPGNSGNIFGVLGIADGSMSGLYKRGLFTEDVDQDELAKVTIRGKVGGIQTDGENYGETWLDNQILYVSPTIAGGLTNVMPTPPNLRIPFAIVLNAHASNGRLLVDPVYIPHIAELNGVDGNDPTTTGQLITWDNELGYYLRDAYNIEDYSTTSEGDDRYVNIAGDTMTGTLQVSKLEVSDNEESYDNLYHGTSHILNGMSEDKQSLYIVVEDGEVYFETEKIGGGDLEYVFNERASVLDCTTGTGVGGRARVQLIQGLADDPQMNYVYVTDGSETANINVSTSFPSGTVSILATVAIGDDIRTAADGPAHLQRWTMSLKHNNDNNFSGDVNGTLYWMQRKLRALGAKYESGIALTTDDTGGVIDLTAGGGSVYQMHPNTWVERQVSVDGAYVANASGLGVLSPYEKLMDLAGVAELVDGSTITNNRYFSITVWGSMNSSDQNGNQSKLYFNLPNGFYTSADGAIADSNNYDVRTAPDEFSTTAFLIGRLTMQRQSGGNAFIGDGVYSLLGQALGSQGGGTGSVASNSFSDAQFNVFNDTDPTKDMLFDASSITSGATRTLAIPDASGTIALTSDLTGTNTSLDTTNFDNNLSSADDTVQKAMETLDELTAGGTSSPLTTKGDLYGYDTDNARIPVGTDNQVLTADSTQALGVKWADASGGGSNSFQIDQSGGASDTYGVLSGTINGSNTTFTVSQSEYISGSLKIYLNGQLQTQGTGEDWVETTPASGIFDFNTAPLSGDEITVAYQFVVSTSGNADTLDGEHGTYYLNHDNLTNKGTNTHSQIDAFMSSSGNTDERGLSNRAHLMVDPTDLLNSAPSLTWASYTGFVTPTVDDTSLPSIVATYYNGGVAGSTKMFGYPSTLYTSFGALLSVGVTNCRAGIRIDDGTDNNFAEIYMQADAGGLITAWYRTNTGGAGAITTSLWGGGSFPSQQYWLTIAQVGGVAYLYIGGANVYQAFVASYAPATWTPTNMGLFAEHPSGGFTDIQRAALFDAIKYY